MEREFFGCLFIVGACAAVQCALFPVLAVIPAMQRHDLSNVIGLASRGVSALAIWYSLSAGYGLLGVTAATAAGNLVDFGLRWIVAHRLIPELRISPRLASWAGFHEVFSFGLWNFLIAVNFAVVMNTDVLLIGLFLPVSAVAVYALASNVARYLGDATRSASQVLYPAATQLDAMNDIPRQRRLLLAGSRMLFLVAIVLGVIGGVWAEDFYRLWVGYKEVGVEGVRSAANFFRILAIAGALDILAGAPGQILLGSRRVKGKALCLLGQAITNVALSVVLIELCGSLGVAIATVVAIIPFKSVLVPWIACRQLSVPWKSFLVQACARPAIVGVLLVGASVALRTAHTPDSWFALTTEGILAGLVALALAFLIGTKAEERNQIAGWLSEAWMRLAGSRRAADPPAEESSILSRVALPVDEG
jgi:O-antigen/teichoic acid export membrane protein